MAHLGNGYLVKRGKLMAGIKTPEPQILIAINPNC